MMMKKFSLLLILLTITAINIHAQNDLDYYIEQAKQNSPLIHRSKNESLIAGLDFEQVKILLSRSEVKLEGNFLLAPIFVHDNGTNSFELVSKGASKYTGYDLASTDGGQFQGGVSLVKPLFKSAEINAYSNKSSVLQNQALNDIDITIHELEQLVRYQYIQCEKARKQAESTRSILEQTIEQKDILQKLVDNAIYRKSDLLLFNIAISNYQADYKTFMAEYETNILDLNILCGINDTEIVNIKDAEFKLNQLNSNPSLFLNSFRLDSLAEIADLSISKMRYKPKLSLYANAGMNAVYLPALNRFGIGTGLTFSWTLFDGHQQKIREQQTNARLNSIDFEKQNFILRQQLQKEKIIRQIKSIEEKNKIIEDQVREYKDLIGIYQSELALNTVSIMDLKNLVNEMAVKEQEMVLLNMERQALINTFNYWNY
jgi:outer membrane protein TolC